MASYAQSDASGDFGELDPLKNDSFYEGIDDHNLDYYLSAQDFLSFSHIHLDESVTKLLTCAYIILVVVALIGNGIVVIVVARATRLRKAASNVTTNVLVVSLALGDLLLALFGVPVQLKFHYEREWTLGEGLCKFAGYAQGVFVVIGILTLTTLSLERYLAICQPTICHHLHRRGFGSKTRIVLVAVGLWFAALLLVSPQLYLQRVEHRMTIEELEDGEMKLRMVAICVEFSPHRWIIITYTLCFYIILYIIPTFVMALAYGKLVPKIRQYSALLGNGLKKTSEATTGEMIIADENNMASNKRTRRVARMLVVMVIVFVVSWCPFFTFQLYLLFHEHTAKSNLAMAFFHLLAYSNSCVNPIIYCSMVGSFGNQLRNTVDCYGRHLRCLFMNGLKKVDSGQSESGNRKGGVLAVNGVALVTVEATHGPVAVGENLIFTSDQDFSL